jgi:hypothetical protein
MASVISDLSPSDLVGRFRGTIFHAAPGYPEVIHLRAKDADGGEWWFSTFYAEYSPSEPDFFLGKTIVDAHLEPSAKLTLSFADGSEFQVVPGPFEPGESVKDLETWHLYSPDGIALYYGPGSRWELGPPSAIS